MAKLRTVSEETQKQELSSLPTPEGDALPENKSKDENGEDLPADALVGKGNEDISDSTLNLTEEEVNLKKEEDKIQPDTKDTFEKKEKIDEKLLPDENKNQDAEVISGSSESTGFSAALLQKEEEKTAIDEHIESEVLEKEEKQTDTDISTAVNSKITKAGRKAGKDSDVDVVTDADTNTATKNVIDSTADNEGDSGSEEVAEVVEKKSTDENTDAAIQITDAVIVEKVDAEEELTKADETNATLKSDTTEEVSVADVSESTPESDPKKEQVEDVKSRKPDSETEDEFESQDFGNNTIEEIVEVVKNLAHYKDMIKADRVLRRITGRMNTLREELRNTALKKFIDEGGDEVDFSYQPDAHFDVYDANFRLIKDRRYHYLKELEKEKESNLDKAEIILDQLRTFLDDSETSASFRIFKEIQNEWKSLGPLPGSHYKSLWANYNALVSRFYDRRSIYFELIELDRKKNLGYKLQLCDKVEVLDNVADLKEAIIQLNELHHEFKHTGPVPRAEQEAVWQRFKAASNKVYARRKEYNTTLKKAHDKNLELKLAIAEKVQSFSDFSSDSIKIWNEKSREILDIQKEWEKVGGLPRDKAKEVNKKFWSAFKKYFSNKNRFFKKLEGQRTENLKLKEDLVVKADALKDSTDWDITAEEMKALQQQWKEIGPVPEKVRNEVYNKFKAACDHFFNCRRDGAKNTASDYEENLNKKQAIIKEIQDLTSKDNNDIDKLKELQMQFYDLGYVPKTKINAIHDEFTNALQEFLDHANQLDDDSKDKILFEVKIEKIKHSPNADRKLYQKEQTLKKQINQVENDISLWNNNIEFFANTKNAEKLKEEFKKRIIKAAEELERMKKQLRLYVSA